MALTINEHIYSIERVLLFFFCLHMCMHIIWNTSKGFFVIHNIMFERYTNTQSQTTNFQNLFISCEKEHSRYSTKLLSFSVQFFSSLFRRSDVAPSKILFNVFIHSFHSYNSSGKATYSYTHTRSSTHNCKHFISYWKERKKNFTVDADFWWSRTCPHTFWIHQKLGKNELNKANRFTFGLFELYTLCQFWKVSKKILFQFAKFKKPWLAKSKEFYGCVSIRC